MCYCCCCCLIQTHWSVRSSKLSLAGKATVTSCYTMNTHSAYQIIVYHSFLWVNLTNLHEVFSHRAKNQSRVVILHFNGQIQVVFMVYTPRLLLVNILSMFSRKTLTLFESLRCLFVVILFKFREKTSNEKNSDHPFHSWERNNWWREADCDVKTQERQIAKRVSKKYEVWCSEVLQVAICSTR